MLIQLTQKKSSSEDQYMIGVETSNVLKMVPNHFDANKSETHITFVGDESIVVIESLKVIFKKLNVQTVKSINA